MRLTNERGVPPLGDLSHQYHIDSHIPNRSAPDGSIQRLFAELTVADRQVRQALAFSCLGARKDSVNPHPKGRSYPSSSRGAAAIDPSYSDGMRLIRVMISSKVRVSSVRFFMSLSLSWPDLSS